MPKPFHIYDEVFMANIWVSYGVSAEVYLKATKDYLPEGTSPAADIEELNATHGNLTVYIKPDGAPIYWIWVKEKNVPFLAHEVFHATYTILDNKGIQLCDASEELFAYYISMIMKKILDGQKKEKQNEKVS